MTKRVRRASSRVGTIGYIVVDSLPEGSAASSSSRMPDGSIIKRFDRSFFERAVKNAMVHKKEQRSE